MNRVIIEIIGGVAYVKRKPKRVTVEVRDFDVEGVDEETLTKVCGKDCVVGVYVDGTDSPIEYKQGDLRDGGY